MKQARLSPQTVGSLITYSGSIVLIAALYGCGSFRNLGHWENMPYLCSSDVQLLISKQEGKAQSEAIATLKEFHFVCELMTSEKSKFEPFLWCFRPPYQFADYTRGMPTTGYVADHGIKDGIVVSHSVKEAWRKE